MQHVAESLRRRQQRIGFVPTMGYLHEGHLSLVRTAKALGDVVVVSIFVNPIQFGATEDLARYPRNLARDMELLEKEKTDFVFLPQGTQMYSPGFSTYVQVKGLENHLCGLTRIGHFAGMATVVAKLFNIVKPSFAVFGQKDYQQLKIIERMVKDLNMDLEVISHPTLREHDGLAMSSRNTYLNLEERETALLLYKSLKRVEELFKGGARDAWILTEEARKVLTSEGGVEIEYVSISDTDSLEELEIIEKKAVLAMACRIGKTRLIDNIILTEEQDATNHDEIQDPQGDSHGK